MSITHHTLTPTITGSRWSEAHDVSADTPAGLFTPTPTNPVLASAVEVSLITEGDTVHAWYRKQTDSKIYYATSTDADNVVWTTGNGGQAISDTSPALGGAIFPFVFTYNGTYYMAAKMGDGNLYLFSSSNKTTWAFANGSNPILTHSGNVNSPINSIFNPAIAVVGSRWHLLIEGTTSVSTFQTSYSYADFSGAINFNTNLSATSVLPTTYDGTVGTGNPWLTYVADRDALLAVYGDRSGNASINVLRAAVCPLANNPALAGSWTQSAIFAYKVAGVHVTDPALTFTTSVNKTWNVLMHFNYNQLTGYSAAALLTLDADDNTSPLTAFYDAVMADGLGIDATGTFQIDLGTLNASTTAGLRLRNRAAASAGQQQFSPAMEFEGSGWATGSGGSSQKTRLRAELRPVQGTSAPTFVWVVMASINGGDWTDIMTFGSDGSQTLAGDSNLGNVFAGGVVKSGAGKTVESQGDMLWTANGYLYAKTRAAFHSPADSQINISNNADTVGIGLDVSTDGTVKIRNRAQNADGQLAAASVRGNAVTFANRPTTPVEGMIVAFTDSTTATWGATISGGGANHVQARYNGSNWTVMGA